MTADAPTSPDGLAQAERLMTSIPMSSYELESAKTLALIDIAKSLRAIVGNDEQVNVLLDIKGELHNIQRYGIGK